MAPPSDDKPNQVNDASQRVDNSRISNVLFVIAMQTEALPLVNKFQLNEDPVSVFLKGVPWVRYHGNYKDLNLSIAFPGRDTTLGIDSVGTVSASLLTYASIQALKPDLIINAGTAGGFKAKGACIGDVCIASDQAFHDRRIPIPVFDLYGVASRQSFPTTNILDKLILKVGKLSAGDSGQLSSVKDMESAAVAYVAELLKAVTDIVDGDKHTAEEFLQNLAAAAAALDLAVIEVVDYINEKMGQL